MRRLLYAFIPGLLLSSCFKDAHYESVPFVSYKDFKITGDSARLTLTFRDGEGDIGLAEDEQNAPYNPGSEYYNNLYLVYYEKTDEFGWQPGHDLNGDTIVFRYRLLPIYSGKPRSISGEIEVLLEPVFYNPFSPDSDTIRYGIQLIDRELHKSKWVFTDPITH